MRNAHVHKMSDAGRLRRSNCPQACHKIDLPELRGFRRTRVRNSNQLHERIRGSNARAVSGAIERVTFDHRAARRQSLLGAATDQSPNLMSALEQPGNQSLSDMTGSSRNEHGTPQPHYEFFSSLILIARFRRTPVGRDSILLLASTATLAFCDTNTP